MKPHAGSVVCVPLLFYMQTCMDTNAQATHSELLQSKTMPL